MKRFCEQFVQYAKDKLNFKKSLRNTFLASAFLGATFSPLFGSKSYAMTQPVKSSSLPMTTQDILDNEYVLEDILASNGVSVETEEVNHAPYFLGDHVYAQSGARIYRNENQLYDQENSLRMRYPETVKEITGMVFLVDGYPKTVTLENQALLYQNEYELIGYLINDNEGFLRVEDVYQKDVEAIIDSSQTDTDSMEVLEEVLESETEPVVEEQVTTEILEVEQATPSNVASSEEETQTFEEQVNMEILKAEETTETQEAWYEDEEILQLLGVESLEELTIQNLEGELASPSNATPSNATPSDATPSNATPSDATPSDATPSNATPSNASIYRINESVFMKPLHALFQNVKDLVGCKKVKEISPNESPKIITGIVVNENVFHASNANELVDLLNNNEQISAYELDSKYYVLPESIYQKDKIQATDSEIAEVSENVYSKDVDLTILPNARIYGSPKDLINVTNSLSPSYKAGTVKSIHQYVLSQDGVPFFVDDYDTVIELQLLGYHFDGYLVKNQYSYDKCGNIKALEGYFRKEDVVSKEVYDATLNVSDNIVESVKNQFDFDQYISSDVTKERRECLLQLRDELMAQHSQNLGGKTLERKLC
ncbi:MAG: hypothetical protein HFI08_05045 [Bacilli bacterium]|nr:hypothetical protein [Bacilli bacterium]